MRLANSNQPQLPFHKQVGLVSAALVLQNQGIKQVDLGVSVSAVLVELNLHPRLAELGGLISAAQAQRNRRLLRQRRAEVLISGALHPQLQQQRTLLAVSNSERERN